MADRLRQGLHRARRRLARTWRCRCPNGAPRPSRAAISRGARLKSFEGGEGGADGKGKLRAGAEPGMRRDRLLDPEIVGRVDAAARGDLPQIAFGALALGSAHREPSRALAQDEPGPRPVEREPERAERTAAPSARIEKAEMKPRRRGHGRLARQVPRRPCVSRLGGKASIDRPEASRYALAEGKTITLSKEKDDGNVRAHL